jgi:hypothetical protein
MPIGAEGIGMTTIEEIDREARLHPELEFFFSGGRLHVRTRGCFE